MVVAQRGHRDAARPGLQRAVQRDLADAGHVDALARVDRHQRTFRQRQADAGQPVLRGLQRAALQGQAGALALRQHALDRVFLVERRRPGLQGPRLVRRGGGVRRQAQQRHRDAQPRAFDDFQATRADQFILREALREVAVRQHRHAGGRGLAALLGAHHADLVGLQGQLAAAVHAARGQRAVQRQHAGRPGRSGLQQQIAAPAGQGLAAALMAAPPLTSTRLPWPSAMLPLLRSATCPPLRRARPVEAAGSSAALVHRPLTSSVAPAASVTPTGLPVAGRTRTSSIAPRSLTCLSTLPAWMRPPCARCRPGCRPAARTAAPAPGANPSACSTAILSLAATVS